MEITIHLNRRERKSLLSISGNPPVKNIYINEIENNIQEIVDVLKPENKNNFIQKDVKTNIPNQINIGKTAKKETFLTEYQSKLQISNPYNHINTENQSDVNIPNYVDASDQRDNFISDDDKTGSIPSIQTEQYWNI